MGERVAGKGEQKENRSLARLAPAPAGWRYRVIGYTALAMGVIGGIVGWRTGGPVVGSLSMGVGLPMIMAPYFVVPRTKTNRIWQGIATGLLSGLIAAAVILVFATGRFLPAWKEMVTTYAEYVLAVVGISWLSVKLSDWTEKRRMKYDADKNKTTSPVQTQTLFPKRPRMRATKAQEAERAQRVHRYNRKNKK